jgi:hypothetical protein
MKFSFSVSGTTVFTVCGLLFQFLFGAMVVGLLALVAKPGEETAFAFLAGMSIVITAKLFLRGILALVIAGLAQKLCKTPRRIVVIMLALNALVMLTALVPLMIAG